MQVRSLGRADPLEKEAATQLRCSCLENPMDSGACWATVHGVTKSWTRPGMSFVILSFLDCCHSETLAAGS